MESPLLETGVLASWLDTPENAPPFCIIETSMNPDAFSAGHLPGSVFWPAGAFFTPDFRLRTDPEIFADLMTRAGVTPDTLVICSFNGEAAMAGWAAWLFWILTSFGHKHTVILNGGTPKWKSENRPLTQAETPHGTSFETMYPVPLGFSPADQATFEQVQSAVQNGATLMLDARTAQEFSGEHYFDAPPTDDQKTGHIYGAAHLFFQSLLHSDGTFLTPAELTALPQTQGLDRNRPVVTYCAVGIRSALVWFAFKHLLQMPDVRNYDGSWNEWSKQIGETAP